MLITYRLLEDAAEAALDVGFTGSLSNESWLCPYVGDLVVIDAAFGELVLRVESRAFHISPWAKSAYAMTLWLGVAKDLQVETVSIP